ncbi:MAG: hypothetical protein DME22_26700 [Verrucomicrobia bacterium]|nr:MAG: hypothetical protein DME22_26700 [Verrucomicrobiota bacterium]
MSELLAAIQGILRGEDGQITIRHLFYRLVGQRLIEKIEKAYKSLCAHLSRWRRLEEIAWSAFADNTRWHIRQPTFEGVEDALKNTVENYRRNLWATQPFYIEVWVEKDAIAGIVAGTANSWGVPVFVCRGFASLSSLYGAANTFKRALRDDFKVDVQFIRLAVTREQIQRLRLPTRPVKTSDSRAKKWRGGECVELDTMPPAEIRRLVEDSITQHIDRRQWQAMKRTEEMERESLCDFVRAWHER